MLYYLYWIMGYDMTDEVKTPEEIIEKIKEKNIEVKSKELLYANVVAELKACCFKPRKFVMKVEGLEPSKLDLETNLIA